MTPDPRLSAATERLMRLFQFSRPNAETLARTVLAAADSVLPPPMPERDGNAGQS